MIVTAKPALEKRGILTLFVDDEPWREVHTSIFGSKINFNVASMCELEEKFKIHESKMVRNFILKRLSMRNYHTRELSKLLKERLIDQKTFTPILKELSLSGLINDQEWLHSYIRREKDKKRGPREIIAKLKLRGVSEIEIRGISHEIVDDAAQKNSIERILSTKYKSYNLKDPKERQKVIQSLIRRGFSFNVIKEIILQ